MADTKTSDLTALTGANLDNDADVLPVVDTSATTLKKITGSQLKAAVQNSQSANYTFLITDAFKHILHPAADTNNRTFTIPANASVAFPVGTMLTFVNEINTITIAITTDTLNFVGDGTTGSRSLAAYGMATLLKTGTTSWWINGTNLT